MIVFRDFFVRGAAKFEKDYNAEMVKFIFPSIFVVKKQERLIEIVWLIKLRV